MILDTSFYDKNVKVNFDKVKVTKAGDFYKVCKYANNWDLIGNDN